MPRSTRNALNSAFTLVFYVDRTEKAETTEANYNTFLGTTSVASRVTKATSPLFLAC